MQTVSQHSARTLCSALFGLGLVASLVCGLPHAIAQDAFRVGVVDPQIILKESAYGKRQRAELEEHASARRKVLESDEEELKKLQAKLQEIEDSDVAALKTLQDQLQRKFQKFQEREQTFQQELSKKQNDLTDEYVEKLQVASKAIAERQGFALIANLNVVLHASKGLDVTKDVLKEFEKLYP